MKETITLKMLQIAPEIETLLANKQNVILPVTGSSMYPFLIEGIDSVELTFADICDIAKGDIVLIKNNKKQYILHRLISKRNDEFFLNGDAQTFIEGPFDYNHLIGKVAAIHRDGKRVDSGKVLIKVAVFLWMLLLPFRKVILRVLRRFK